MKRVFADTAYWIAITNRQDSLHDAAIRAHNDLGPGVQLVTTDEVLTEFLTAMSRMPALRKRATESVRKLLDSSRVRVEPQTRRSFLKGLARHERRADKTSSLPDCISMEVMEAERITEVLTSDADFRREGCRILIDRK